MRNLYILLLFIQFSYAQNLHQYINPMIGTGGHGHTYPGATVPYGMVQLSPDTRIDGSWDGCSGYHYSDSTIYGFSHTHLNGTGCSDYGDIMLMPTMGEPSFNNKEYSSTFSHSNENASAGFYSVKLDKNNIDVRLTTSTRVGFHEYTFNNSGQANIILDLNHRDKLLAGEVKIIDDKTIEVYRNSEAWAKNQKIYARIVFNKPMKLSKEIASNYITPTHLQSLNELKIAVSCNVQKGEKILVKVALSPTGYEGAKLNMTEIPHWDFNKAKLAAELLWNTELSKIEIQTSNNDKKTVFYTALYHTMVQPNIAQDIDGKYRGRDDKIHTAEGFTYYSVFSLWDTFRATHPLYTLIDKKRTADYINTFIAQYEQGGRLPVWELASNETDCMIGYHAVSVIADAMVKGIKGFDYEKAYKASKHSAMLDHFGLDAYKKYNLISIDDEHESVSKTLEYAYDDWCIAQMAMVLGKKEDYAHFMQRAQSWKNVFDIQTGFMRGKKNGGWHKPFDPREINNNYTEGNSWHYSFFVPQDIAGMINAYGGAATFEKKLDELFNSESKTTGREQVDVTGLIGQYAHGNEPSHHIAYLYNYVDKPEKTKEKVHYILNNFYKNTPDGLIGNEDCGQMSAWYVLSCMGIYSVTPGQIQWAVTEPYFDKITLNVDNSVKNITKKSLKSYLKLLGTKYEEFGKTASFEVKDVLTDDKNISEIVTVPIFKTNEKSFKDFKIIEMETQMGKVYYSFNPKEKYKEYTKPFEITSSQTIYAYAATSSGKKSKTISASFYKKPNNYTIKLLSQYNPQYHAGGSEGLLDGIYGTTNWRKGDWQGYQKQNFEAVINLQNETNVSNIALNFLQDSRSWIVMPKKVLVYASNDGENFEKISEKTIEADALNYAVFTKKITLEFPMQKAKFIKVIAENYGKFPKTHQAEPFDGDAFIFIDEIAVNSKITSDNKIICDLPIVIRIPNLFFNKNEFLLRKDAIISLEKILYTFKQTPSVEIEIRGHCDATEIDAEKLSLNRAKAAKEYLVSKGMDKNKIIIKGFAATQIINHCNKNEICTDEEHQPNRRCEIIVTKM